jgi:hypothetical protein
MKTKIIITAATLSVMFVLYSTRLLQAVESNSLSTDAPSATASAVVFEQGRAQAFAPPKALKSVKLKSTYNRFVIDNTRQCELVGRRGTKLVLPANIFEDENGVSAQGAIEIVMKECYDLDEILAEKLSTTSDGRIIETAGMIHIEATQSDIPLRLKKEVQYTVFFPTQGKSVDGFELFYGNPTTDGIVNWTPASQASGAPNLNGATLSSIKEDCFIQICESEFRRRTQISEMDYFNWELKDGQTLNQWFVSNFNPDANMVDDFCSDKLISRIAFHVNADGSFKDYYIAHESKTAYDRVIAEFLSAMPPLNLSKVMPIYSSDHLCVLTFGHQQGASSDQFVKRFAKRYDYADDRRPMTNVNSSDLDYYMFSSTELGWLNCDRFINERAPLVEFRVKARTTEGSSVSMVFEDRKSIVRGIKMGDEFVFSGVPNDRKVRLVAVDNNGGSPQMQEARTMTSKKVYRMDSYEPMTLSKLDAAMCWK